MATTKVLDKNTIGYRIRESRTNKKMSQKELAGRVHISHGSMSNYETGIGRIPDDVVEALARELGVTSSYLKGIEPKKVSTPFTFKADPQPFKTALKNHEGYLDSTANKAVAIVMNSTFHVGDVVVANSNMKTDQVLYVVLALIGKRAWVSELTKTVGDDNTYVYTIRNGAHVYYADISKVTTRYTDSLKKKLFETPELTMNKISDRFKGIMFPIGDLLKVTPAPAPIQTPEIKEEEPDEISKVFSDSISYFNEKNGTSIEVPKGIVTLQQAIDISEKHNLPLTELIKDHTEDRVLDEICKYEAKIAELKAKIGL